MGLFCFDDYGLLLINIPVSTGLFYRAAQALLGLGIAGPFERMWQKEFPSPHVSYFTPENLKTFFENHGFVQVSGHSLKSVQIKGLWERIRYDRSRSIAYSGIIYLAVIFALPLIKIFPSDIHLQLFKITDVQSA